MILEFEGIEGGELRINQEDILALEYRLGEKYITTFSEGVPDAYYGDYISITIRGQESTVYVKKLIGTVPSLFKTKTGELYKEDHIWKYTENPDTITELKEK